MRKDHVLAVRVTTMVRDAIHQAAEADFRPVGQWVAKTLVDRLVADGFLDRSSGLAALMRAPAARKRVGDEGAPAKGASRRTRPRRK
jgi:hypothetical protein